jgi:hypothetical protein
VGYSLHTSPPSFPHISPNFSEKYRAGIMNLDNFRPKAFGASIQLEMPVLNMDPKAHVLALAILRSCFEGESEISILLVLAGGKQLKHFSCHIDPLLTVSQSLRLVVEGPYHGQAEEDQFISTSVLILDTDGSDVDFSSLQLKVSAVFITD